MTEHPVVSREQWLAARKGFLAREKELTRLRAKLAEERRALPWVKVEKAYTFQGPDGPVTLADLFGDRNQLIVQHFMFGPDWEAGCMGCSFSADHVAGALYHLPRKDVAFAAVSRAPIDKLEAFRTRMGWDFRWVSSLESDFNFDFGVSFTPDEIASGRIHYNYTTQDWAMDEMPGMSVFFRDADGSVYHTYSTYGRGLEDFILTYDYLDITPKGRAEGDGNLGDWVKRHDEYGE